MSNEVRENAWLRRNPPHPGPGILNGVDGMTLGEAAKRLGVSRASLSRLVNARCAISPAMALKLERAGWGTADIWVRLQAAYDLAQARRRAGDLRYGGFEESTQTGIRCAARRDRADPKRRRCSSGSPRKYAMTLGPL